MLLEHMLTVVEALCLSHAPSYVLYVCILCVHTSTQQLIGIYPKLGAHFFRNVEKKKDGICVYY